MSASKAAIQRSRRVFTPEQKTTILRRHLGDKVTVSDLCDEYQLSPSLFYLWQKQALEHLTAALQDGRTARGESQTASADRTRIATLEATLLQKDRIIAGVSEGNRLAPFWQANWRDHSACVALLRSERLRAILAHECVDAIRAPLQHRHVVQAGPEDP